MSFSVCVGLGLVLLLVTGTVCGLEEVQGEEQNGGKELVSDMNNNDNHDGTRTTASGEETVKEELDNAAIEREGPVDTDTDLHTEETDQTETEMRLKQYQALVEWIEDQGGYMKHCSFQHIPGAGVGVIAAEDLEETTIISLIPYTAVISEQLRVLPSSSSLALRTKFLSGALFLAAKKYTGDSVWQPFINILPEQELGLPLLFTDEEINVLEGSEVKTLAEEDREEYFKEIDRLIQDIKKKPQLNQFVYLNRSMLLWGVAMWLTRSFNVAVPDKERGKIKCSGLVPLADMYNMAVEDGERNMKCGFYKDPNYFTCWTTRAVKEGEELLLDYKYDHAERTNLMLLSSYGFVVKDNPYDAVRLQPPNIRFDHSMIMRLEASEALDCMEEDYYHLNRTTEEGYGTVNELIQFMRISEGTEGEIQREIAGEDPFQHPLSKETELKALRAATEYLKDALEKYPTSAEEDRVILDKSDSLSMNVRNAVLLRYEEKCILQENIDYLGRMYKLLVEGDNSNECTEVQNPLVDACMTSVFYIS